MLEGLQAAGAANSFQKMILLDTRLDSQQEGEVYIHELVEMANSFFELNLAHHKIQTLALALHQALTSGEGRLKK